MAEELKQPRPVLDALVKFQSEFDDMDYGLVGGNLVHEPVPYSVVASAFTVLRNCLFELAAAINGVSEVTRLTPVDDSIGMLIWQGQIQDVCQQMRIPAEYFVPIGMGSQFGDVTMTLADVPAVTTIHCPRCNGTDVRMLGSSPVSGYECLAPECQSLAHDNWFWPVS